MRSPCPAATMVEHVLLLGEVDIGLVHQQDRPLRLVLQRPPDVFARGDRAGGVVVGVADVDHAGGGVRRHHRLDVVSVGRGQRHLVDRRTAVGGRQHRRLVRWVGGNEAAGRRGEGQHGIVERLGRTGVDGDVLRLQAVLFSEGLGERTRPGRPCGRSGRRAALGDVGDGFARRLAGAQRILVGVDHHRVGRRHAETGAQARQSEAPLGDDRDGGRQGGTPQECPTVQRGSVRLGNATGCVTHL